MDKTITTAGRRLFYRDEGEGIPVLLVHGFAEDGKVWDAVAGGLKAGCRLLIPDLPGSGRSDLLAGETTMESLAVALVNLLDAAEIPQCVMIGHSMGGYITLAFAERYPERLRAFGFFHSTASPDTAEKKINRQKSIAFIRELGAAPYIRQSTPNLFAPETREHRPSLIEEMIRRYSGFETGSLTAYLAAMMQRPDRSAVLERFHGPVLFIIGEKDQVVPPDQSLRQSHVPPVAQISILPATGHMGMLEAPDAGAEAIRSFLNFINQS
ncbi:MAG TPA: alpha/beta fold hydrolase [Puia sp.]|nr:alpha/beta fold hydrolase [Puia sp.]